MSVGLAILVGIEKNAAYSFGFIPNYRVYFGGKKANGFFIEGNAAVISNRDDDYDYNFLAYTTYRSGYQSNVNPNS